MNIKAAGNFGIYLLKSGGLQAVSDFRTLTNVVVGISTKKTTLAEAITPENLDAIERSAKLIASAVQDDAQRANLGAIFASL